MGVEKNKFILPLLVYLPILLVLIMFLGFFGVRIIDYFKDSGNLKNIMVVIGNENLFNRSFYKKFS